MAHAPAPQPLRAEAVDPRIYEAQRDEREHSLKRAGWSRAYARQNQLLPYAGTTLTPGDIDRLVALLERIDGNNLASPTDRETAALLTAIVTTGRSLADLANLPVEHQTDHPPPHPALVIGDEWTWWLVPGAPTSSQHPRPGTADAPDRPTLIPLPCSARTRRLIESVVALPHCRGIFLGLPTHWRRAARRMLIDARIDVSIKKVESWLFHQLARMKGGDVALAALVTGQTPPIARSVIHYTRVDVARVPHWLGIALDGIDQVGTPRDGGAPMPIGSRYVPDIADVRHLVDQVSRPLDPARRASRKTRDIHNAMTLYTILFFFVSTGCRPSRRLLPKLDAIDPMTGFMIVDDKPTIDRFKARLIWVSPSYREQLRYYQEHCEAIGRQRRMPSPLPAEPFLLDVDDQAVPLTMRGLDETLHARGWSYPRNAGRHFLRSVLLGKLNSDALHAFLGHWHLGTDPWGERAGLDPLAYRDELAAVLSPLLAAAGLIPRRGLA